MVKVNSNKVFAGFSKPHFYDKVPDSKPDFQIQWVAVAKQLFPVRSTIDIEKVGATL
jgi:hypothetical protein